MVQPTKKAQEKLERSRSMKPIAFAAIAGIALVFASTSPAHAQDADKNKKVRTFDFSGDEIDGELVKPDGEFIDPRKFANHTSLIRIRRDFIKEIIKSAEDL
jgi:hypothetical protein